MYLPKLQKIVVAALEDIKARDIEVINTTKLSALFDRIVIASADSTRQTKALARSVHDKVTEAGGEVMSIEGAETGEWVLVRPRQHRRAHHAARRAQLLQPRRVVAEPSRPGARSRPNPRFRTPTER